MDPGSAATADGKFRTSIRYARTRPAPPVRGRATAIYLTENSPSRRGAFHLHAGCGATPELEPFRSIGRLKTPIGGRTLSARARRVYSRWRDARAADRRPKPCPRRAPAKPYTDRRAQADLAITSLRLRANHGRPPSFPPGSRRCAARDVFDSTRPPSTCARAPTGMKRRERADVGRARGATTISALDEAGRRKLLPAPGAIRARCGSGRRYGPRTEKKELDIFRGGAGVRKSFGGGRWCTTSSAYGDGSATFEVIGCTKECGMMHRAPAIPAPRRN